MRTAGALALLLAMTAGIFWKLTLSDRYTWLENPDQALQVRPWFEYEAREWHAGRVPLWIPYEVAGQTLIGEVQPGVVNPLNWPLFAVPLRDGWIRLRSLHWWWVLLHWVAAVFAYLLCRDLQCGQPGSILGGAIFGLAGYIGWAGTPAFLTSSLWFPLVLLFLARLFRGERLVANGALCGAALGASFLGGHHNVPIYSAVVAGAAWVWLLVRDRRSRRVWIAAAACLGLCILISAVQALPAIEYGRQALRWSGAPEAQHWNDKIPYSVHDEHSIRWRSIPGMIVPGITVHANPFVGIVAIGLAFAAIRWSWKSPDTRLSAFVAVFAILLALGADTPVHRLAYRFIPLVEKARYPAMTIVIAQAAIAALAARGLSLGRDALRRAALPYAVFGAAGLAIYLAWPLWQRFPLAWVVPAAAVGMAVVLRWTNASPCPVIALFLVEAAIIPRPILQPRDVPNSFAAQIAAQADLADFLRRQPGWFRIEVEEDSVPYNFGDLYSLEQFNGYVASMPERVNRVMGDPNARRWYGVRYWIGRAPQNPAQIEVFRSRSGVRIFRNPDVAEPLWARREAPCPPDGLRVLSRRPNAAAFEADLACPALFVVGDPYYRGWRASIDGRRAPIQEFEGGIRALRADSGRHTVEFFYEPKSVYLGAGLTVLGVLLVFGVLLRTVSS